MNVIIAIEDLMLGRLDGEFIESVWDQEFMCDVMLPDEYMEFVNTWDISIFNEIIEAIDKWQTECQSIAEDSEQKTWKELSELKLDHKALLTVLWYFIVTGQENKHDIDSKYVSLKAATLYLKLLAVSGSRVYHAFHPYLCLKTISVLKYALLINPKHKKRSKKQFGEEALSDSFGAHLSDIHLNKRVIVSLIEELVTTMEALKSFVNKFILQSDQELLEEIIERLAEITRLEVNTSNFMTYRSANKSNIDVALSSLAYNAYETLKLLCLPQHGEVEETIITVMKHLLPGVLLADHELSFREQCTVREHTVHFIKYLYPLLGDVTIGPIIKLIHNIFTKIGDKAEIRQKGKESIVDIMQILPNKQYTAVVKWLFDCAHCEKASYRLLALEIIAQLLHDHEAPIRDNDMNIENDAVVVSNESNINVNSEENEFGTQVMVMDVGDSTISGNNPPSTAKDILLYKYMLAVIFARCRDSSASVRTKALALQVQCMKSDNMVVRSLMNEIFVLNQQTESNERGFLNYKQLLAALKKKSNVDPLPSAGMILSELKNLACDNKVYVRKAALQTLENIMKLNRSWLTGNILKIMGLCCRDPAVSIRKEMVQILSDLLQRYPDDRELIKVWAKSVVPLVFDQEGKLQECVLKHMHMMIIDNLTQYNQQQDDIWSVLPWQLLTHIVQFNLHMCLMKACEIWAKEREISNSLVKNVCSHVGTENNLTAWIVLYCLSLHMELKNPMFALDYYRQAISSKQGSVSLMVIVLEVLLSCSAYLPRHVQEEMLEEFKSSLSNFGVERELIRLNVEIAVELTYHLADSKKQALRSVRSWSGELLETCQTYLEDTFQLEATKILDGEQFVRHLHTLGEIVIHNPKQIRLKTLRLLQRYLFLPERNSVGSLSYIPVAKPLTVVAVGKLCLLNKLWAEEAIKPLVKLLHTTQDLPILLNIVYVLRDLCVRYGVIMEPYLPSLWICLKDAAVDVRFTVLTCLVELLQNNYIKLRGVLFFHILSMICDSDESIVELVTYFLHDFLIPMNKNIMFEHIIDALFHYNNYKGHEIYGKTMLSREEEEKFLLKGCHLKDERQKLYEFMLENMDDEHRMKTKSNLVSKVLDGVVEKKIRLDEIGENVILDAIRILNSKYICLRALQPERDEDSPGENTENNLANMLLKAKRKAIAECEKKFMVESIVPVVIRLKAVFHERHSRLISTLMEYLRDMMKEYKNEVKEIFAEDKRTANEILSLIAELERRERRSENFEIEQEIISHRTSDDFPVGIKTLLENAAPWVRQSIGPEIFRCYKIGGEELMLRYAKNKLRRLKQKTKRLSNDIRPNSQSHLHASQDSFVEPKEEDFSENDDSRELECAEGGSYDVRLGAQECDGMETGDDSFETECASEDNQEEVVEDDKVRSENCERRQDILIHECSTGERDERNEELAETLSEVHEEGEHMNTNHDEECKRNEVSEFDNMNEADDNAIFSEEHQQEEYLNEVRQVENLHVTNKNREEQELSEEFNDIEYPANCSFNENNELMEETSEAERHSTDTSPNGNHKRTSNVLNDRSKKMKKEHRSKKMKNEHVSSGSQCNLSLRILGINGSPPFTKTVNNR